MIAPLDDDVEPDAPLTDDTIRDIFQQKKAENRRTHLHYIQASLRELNETPSDPKTLWSELMGRQMLQPSQKAKSTTSTTRDSVGIKHVNDDSSRVWRRNTNITTLECAPQAFQLTEAIRPAPRYELVAPATTNQMVDWSAGDALDCLPFPDDDSFPHLEYLEGKTLKWEHLHRNVNDDFAYIETANNIVKQYHLTDTQVSKLLNSDALFPGLKYDQVMSVSDEYLERTAYVGPNHASKDTICNLPYCLVPNCIHVQARKYLGIKPRAQFEAYRPTPPSTRCGRSCYRNSKGLDKEVLEEWDHDQEAILQASLDVYPDAPSCELAASCQSTCLQVHLHRLSLFDALEPDIGDVRKVERGSRRVVVEKTAFKKYAGLPFFVPCDHSGPCNNESCMCFSEARRCGRSCPCSPACARKPVPCDADCACNTAHCPCLKDWRECDPEVCHCGVMRAGPPYCPNLPLQRAIPPRTLVTLSDHGWGLYACENIARYQFVGEYVGEYVRKRREDNQLVDITYHLERSYTFDVTKKWCIDSLYIGNHTRFMNHGSAKNVEPRSISVNGDIRLAFFATRDIAKGRELIIHYGGTFFKGQKEILNLP